jgi:hypothetical protein
MIVDDNSTTDVDALREDFKFELIVLHGEVKELNKSWDFAPIINPLLADQGPALLLVPRIRSKLKLKEDFEQKARDLQPLAAALAQVAQSFCVAEFPNTKEGKPVKQCKTQRRRQHPPDIAIDEVLPSWGKCKRYPRSMDQKHDKIAKQIYDMILRSPNPKRCCQRELQGNLLCAISNSWLVFQNIKDAALRKDFSLVQIAYNKNEALLAAMADTDPDRKAFVAWASVILDATICQYFWLIPTYSY